MSDHEETLRLDKWLWHARFYKSRTLATKRVTEGGIRVNRQPVRKANHSVRPGDVLTFPLGPHVRVIRVEALGERRGPAPEARTLYTDLDPPAARREDDTAPTRVAPRERGAGRPTKRDRRDLDRLRARGASD
jgi:ribosome-associated heat shock protein Hsp15